MKVTEKEEVTKKQDSSKDKDATAKDKDVKEVKETKDADTLTFEGSTYSTFDFHSKIIIYP